MVLRVASWAVAASVVVRTAVALLLVVDVRAGCNKNYNKLIYLTRKSLVTKLRGAPGLSGLVGSVNSSVETDGLMRHGVVVDR